MRRLEDQETVIERLEAGGNVFLTGAGGTGKTYTIKRWMEETNRRVAITATTGVAALNLGGETVHRRTGIGHTARPELAPGVVTQWRRRQFGGWRERDRWGTLQGIDTIVIDEVSMLRRDQIELIDKVLRGVRDLDEPFGGVQLVCVGDFFQLPPVVTQMDASTYPDLVRPFCFQSKIWDDFENLELTKNWRQSDDQFKRILNDLRRGKVTEEAREALNAAKDTRPDLNIEPMVLFPFRRDVAAENHTRLAALPGPYRESVAEMDGSPGWGEALKREAPADEVLLLKEGAQVMMLINDSEMGQYVNGSMGIIKSIEPGTVTVELANGNTVVVGKHTWEKNEQVLDGDELVTRRLAGLTQYPLKTAWASTIHKCQGLTLDAIETDLSGCFTHGQAYVALSRVKSLSGLVLRAWDAGTIRAAPEVVRFYEEIT